MNLNGSGGGLDAAAAPFPVRRMRKTVVAIGLVVLVVVGVAAGLSHLARERVLARATAPDGTEMCLVQRCNWSGEPFTTTFVVRRPGAAWAAYYYDHEDTYWNRARVELDVASGAARFFRGARLAVTFQWPAGVYTLHWRQRTQDAPSWGMPVGWEPGRL